MNIEMMEPVYVQKGWCEPEGFQVQITLHLASGSPDTSLPEDLADLMFDHIGMDWYGAISWDEYWVVMALVEFTLFQNRRECLIDPNELSLRVRSIIPTSDLEDVPAYSDTDPAPVSPDT